MAGWERGPHHEVGVAWLDAQLRQHPDAIGQLQGLVEHVLTLHVPLGDCEDVATLQPAAHGLWGSEGPQSVTGEGLGAGEGQWDGCGGCAGVLPALRGQSLIWNWASFSLGMSFHVARKTCRSGRKGEGRWDLGNSWPRAVTLSRKRSALKQDRHELCHSSSCLLSKPSACGGGHPCCSQ